MRTFWFRVSLGDGKPFDQSINAFSGERAEIQLRELFPASRQITLLRSEYMPLGVKPKRVRSPRKRLSSRETA